MDVVVYLGHHATPGDDIGRTLRSGPLLEIDDGFQETI